MGSETRIIVIAPLLRARRVASIDASARPAVVTSSQVELDRGPTDVALAAKRAGADVLFLGLADALVSDQARQRLGDAGIASEWIDAAGAATVDTRYVSAGEEQLAVLEHRLPGNETVDRLLDRLGERVAEGAAMVVAAGDLDGSRRLDFVERVVGRAWGLGVPTFATRSGESLKLAFHTQPLGAVLPASELRLVSPPDKGVEEDEEQTLKRIFEDPIRLLLLSRDDGTITAAVRGETRDLGSHDGVDPGQLAGCVAAMIAGGTADHLAAAESGLRFARGLS